MDRIGRVGCATTDKTSSSGYDIGKPQCDAVYPAHPAFGIVGVNRGIVFSPNPCLSSEIAWAGGTNAQLYANTGNPGPALSTHWPDGQLFPAACNPDRTTNPSDRDTADCAYDYGYNAAADSYNDAVAGVRVPRARADDSAGSAWWFDVETSNSWRSAVALNVAALQGAVASPDLDRRPGTRESGPFHTVPMERDHGRDAQREGHLGAFKSWVAGARAPRKPARIALAPASRVVSVALAQYPQTGFDADLQLTAAVGRRSTTVWPACRAR